MRDSDRRKTDEYKQNNINTHRTYVYDNPLHFDESEMGENNRVNEKQKNRVTLGEQQYLSNHGKNITNQFSNRNNSNVVNFQEASGSFRNSKSNGTREFRNSGNVSNVTALPNSADYFREKKNRRTNSIDSVSSNKIAEFSKYNERCVQSFNTNSYRSERSNNSNQKTTSVNNKSFRSENSDYNKNKGTNYNNNRKTNTKKTGNLKITDYQADSVKKNNLNNQSAFANSSIQDKHNNANRTSNKHSSNNSTKELNKRTSYSDSRKGNTNSSSYRKEKANESNKFVTKVSEKQNNNSAREKKNNTAGINVQNFVEVFNKQKKASRKSNKSIKYGIKEKSVPSTEKFGEISDKIKNGVQDLPEAGNKVVTLTVSQKIIKTALIIILIGVTIVAGIGSIKVARKLCSVSEIKVLGDSVNYKVAELSEIKIGECMFDISTASVAKTISQNNPYINARVTKKWLSTINISVSLRKAYAAVEYRDGYVLIDKDGLVLEFISRADMSTDKYDVFTVIGLETVGYQKGELIGDRTLSKHIDDLMIICQAVKSTGMNGKILKIDISNSNVITLITKDRLNVIFGNAENAESKLNYIAKFSKDYADKIKLEDYTLKVDGTAFNDYSYVPNKRADGNNNKSDSVNSDNVNTSDNVSTSDKA